MLKGVDISEFQGEIDWEVLKLKIDFVIIRAGYGKNNIDKQFARNISECNRLNIPCGVYWFSYAYNIEMAQNEANYVLEAIKDYDVQYPICFDFEYDSVKYAQENGVIVNKYIASNIVKVFCDEIQKNNYYVMNYTNEDFINNYFNEEVLEKYDIWYAEYSNQCNRKVGIWQYSDTGSLLEGRTNLDLDYSFNNYEILIRNKKLNNQSKNKVNEKVVKVYGKFLVEATDGLNIRAMPTIDSEVVGSYGQGESVIYDEIIKNGGYVWISWIGNSGNRRYMAMKNLNNGKSYGKLV